MSEAGGIVQKEMSEAEGCFEAATDGLDAEGFGPVMAPEKEIDPPLHGFHVGVVGSFAGNQGVDPGFRGLCEKGRSSAGDDGEAADLLRSPRNHLDRAANRLLEVPDELRSRSPILGGPADGSPLPGSEGLLRLEAQRLKQAGGVAHLRMTIEREVAGIQGHGRLQEEAGLPKARPYQAGVGVPEEAMMHEDEIGTFGGGPSEDPLTCVHGGHEGPDGSWPSHLQAVPGPGIVFPSVSPEEIIQKTEYVFGFTRHGCVIHRGTHLSLLEAAGGTDSILPLTGRRTGVPWSPGSRRNQLCGKEVESAGNNMANSMLT